MTQSVEELLTGGGGTSWKPEVGDTVTGFILKQNVRQMTEFGDRTTLRFFPDGRPMNQVIYQLQTEENDSDIEDDDGVRLVWAGFEMRKAIGDACKKAGVKSTAVGGKLQVKCTGTVKNKFKTQSKQYSARYKPGDPVADEFEADSEPTPTPRKAAPKAAPEPDLDDGDAF